jgi:2-polyprenyl-6-methoxyphenol hydroxylase-like FAD-dependent oxidoreductase
MTESKSLNILIVGAGVCGPFFALLLQRSNPNHNITIIERWSSLRTGGQQLDITSQCVPIMRRLNLLEDLRQYCVNEGGMEVVDHHGRSLMKFGVTKADEKSGKFELTNEFEFMRGDFVKMIYTATLKEREKLDARGDTHGSLTYMFNTSITALSQNSSNPASTTVTFSSGESRSYDLVVAADGQSSRTRRLAFGETVNKEALKSLNIHAAFYNIPRLPHEDSLARIYFGSQNRGVMTRTGDQPFTQVYLLMMQNALYTPSMRQVHKQPLDEQKAAWTKIYHDAGWDCERFTREMQHVDDFYSTEIVQVKMPAKQLYTGRVVLLGDAGYCPSPFTGMGNTLSIIGAYTLTGELFKHPDDVDAALKAYEEGMKAPVEENQKLSSWVKDGKGLFPQSKWALRLMYYVLWAMAVLRINKLLELLAGLVPEGSDGTWQLPEYSGMNVEAP